MHKNQPRVSVILPNYGHAPFLKERIDSILGQTFRDFELIILDDCSQDNSREIIEQYRSYPNIIQIVYNEQNSGSTFKQWKKGIDLAKGEYIWLAESDDWCELTFLQTMIDAFAEHPDIVLAYCSSLAIRGQEIERVVFTTNELKSVLPGMAWHHRNLLDKAGVFNASAALFKREALTSTDLEVFQQYKLCGDLFFWFQLTAKGKVYTTCKILNYCRRHETNVTEGRSKDGIGFIEYLQFLEFAKSDPAYDKEVESYVKYKVADHFLYMTNHDVFVSKEAERQVFGAICRFLPGFKNQYKLLSIKTQLHHLKEQGQNLLKK